LANGQWVHLVFEKVDFKNLVGFHPRLDPNYDYEQPIQRDDGWLTSTYKKENVDGRALEITKDIIDDQSM